MVLLLKGIDHNLVINKAMEMISASTCIKFQPYDGTQKDYVIITNNKTGCWSTAGRLGGPQVLNLHDPGCTSVN
jgi:Astacin (Peptidase family M12A)